MSDIRITNPKCRVFMADGSVIEDLQTINFDMIRYEETARKQNPKWGSPSETPITFASFIAWAAAQRTGATALKWDEWKVQAEDVSIIGEDDVSPTPPGPEPG